MTVKLDLPTANVETPLRNSWNTWCKVWFGEISGCTFLEWNISGVPCITVSTQRVMMVNTLTSQTAMRFLSPPDTRRVPAKCRQRTTPICSLSVWSRRPGTSQFVNILTLANRASISNGYKLDRVKCPSQRRDPKFKRKCPANGVRYLQQEDIEARRVMDYMAGWPLTRLGSFSYSRNQSLTLMTPQPYSAVCWPGGDHMFVVLQTILKCG